MKTVEKKIVSVADGKLLFEIPVIEVIALVNDDVITSSGGFEGPDDPSDL